MNHPKKRQWALTSNGAEAGKSTFLATNARPPIMVVDSDGRFDAVEPLVDGVVLYPSQMINTLDLAEELIKRIPEEGAKSLLWDSLTKIYSLPARLGFMRNQQGRQRVSSSRASEMIDKSNAMTIARDLAILGTDVYYCWHLTTGVDGLGASEVRDMISAVEKDRLMTSVNVTLEFFKENGSYGISVQRARDFGGRKANTGFVVYDEPGNYWRGGAALLEELIYTPFSSKEDAVSWAAALLSLTPEEAQGEYDHLRETTNPESHGQMFTAWYLHVRDSNADNTLYKSENPPKSEPEKEPELKPVAEVAGNETKGFPDWDIPESIPVSEAEAVARESLLALESMTVGNVVFAAATAWPDKFTADQALLKLRDWPEVPDDAELRMERVIKNETGEKMFDWLEGVEV